MWKPKLIGALVLMVITVILVVQNNQPMTTRFLFWNIPLSRSLTLLIIFLAGGIAGSLITVYWRRYRSKPKVVPEPESGQQE